MNPKLVKDFHTFVDGRSYTGLVQDVEPPKLVRKCEEVLNGGMIAAIDVPMHLEKLEMSFTTNEHNKNLLLLYGVASGSGVLLRLRLAVENCDPGAQAEPVEYVVRGIIREIDPGTVEVGKKSEIKYQMSLTYFRQSVNDEVVIEIDTLNYVFIVGGIDIYASRRRALAL